MTVNSLKRHTWLLIPFFYSLYKLILPDALLKSGEMFAEMGNNYFPAATLSLPEALLTTDAGYIPLLNRILGVLVSSFDISAITTPYVYYWIGYLGGALGVASIAHPWFRRAISSDSLRFAMASIYLLALPIENMVYLNFNYAFLLPISMWLYALFRTQDSPGFWGLLFPLIMFGKPAFILFVPIAAFVWLKNRNLLPRLSLFIGILGSCLQIGILKYNQTVGTYNAYDYDASLLELIWAFIRGIVAIPSLYTLGPLVSHGDITAPLILSTGLLNWLYKKWPSLEKESQQLMLWGGAIVFFSVGLHCIAIPSSWVKTSTYLDTRLNRHEIAAATGIFIAIIGLVMHLQKRNPKALLGFLVWAIISGWAWNGLKPIEFPKVGFGSWNTMATEKRLKQDAFFIPLEPFGWFYSQNVLLPTPNSEKKRFSKTPVTSITLSLNNVSVFGTMIGIKPEGNKPVSGKALLTLNSGKTHTLPLQSKMSSKPHFQTYTLDKTLQNATQITYTFEHPVTIWSYKHSGAPVHLVITAE